MDSNRGVDGSKQVPIFSGSVISTLFDFSFTSLYESSKILDTDTPVVFENEQRILVMLEAESDELLAL